MNHKGSNYISLYYLGNKFLMPQCGINQNGAKRQHLLVFAFLHDQLLGHGLLATSKR